MNTPRITAPIVAIPRIERMLAPRYVFKSKHKYKKFAITQMTVSSYSCVKPVCQVALKKRYDEDKNKAFGYSKRPKF